MPDRNPDPNTFNKRLGAAFVNLTSLLTELMFMMRQWAARADRSPDDRMEVARRCRVLRDQVSALRRVLEATEADLSTIANHEGN